jgi:hypothetical protein
MKHWTRKIGVAAVLSSLVLSLGSCADNEDMIVIMGVMSADPPDCMYIPSAAAPVFLSGVVDVAFGGYYNAVLLVSNQLMSTGSKSRLRAEGSFVSINNAVVRLLVDGQTQLSYDSVPASGFIPVGIGEDSGYGSIPVQVMRGGFDALQSGHFVVAEIKLQGRTSGGDDIESNVFQFQIGIVNSGSGGGLVVYTETDANGVGYCNPDTCAETGGGTVTQSCSIGQDRPVSCCDCMNVSDVCRESP